MFTRDFTPSRCICIDFQVLRALILLMNIDAQQFVSQKAAAHCLSFCELFASFAPFEVIRSLVTDTNEEEQFFS